MSEDLLEENKQLKELLKDAASIVKTIHEETKSIIAGKLDSTDPKDQGVKEDYFNVVKNQRKRIEHLEQRLGETVNAMKDMETEMTDEAIRECGELVAKISEDSKGFLARDKLSYLSLSDLRTIRSTFLTKNAQDYEAYFNRRRAEVDTGKVTPGLTVGEYDQRTKQWKTK